MARDVSHLEPAERDPAQLRRTGLALAVIMVLGGVLVMAAYLVKQRADAQDDRPHIVGRLTERFGGRDQNNKVFTTQQLEGKISLLTALAGSQQERIAESLRMMKEVAETYPDDENLRFVGITVEPEQDGLPELQNMLVELGVAEDERWFFVQAEEENARGYLRHKLRMETEEKIPSESEGWTKRFRSTIALIDPNLHLLEPQFDLNLSREVQSEAQTLLEENPKRAEKLDAAKHADALQKAEARLFEVIEDIRAGNLKEGKSL